MIKKVLLTVFLVLVQTVVFAVTKTYTGPNNGVWNTAANWSPSGVPSSSDDVIIPTGDTVTVNVNAQAKSIVVVGNLTLATTYTLIVYGDFTVTAATTGPNVPEGNFKVVENGNSTTTLIVLGNYINNGKTDFDKGDVIIVGNLITPETSTLQNLCNVIVGGDIIGDFNLQGSIQTNQQIYAVNPNATVTITPDNIDKDVVPGTPVTTPTESSTLVGLVNLYIYGGNCTFTVNNIANVSACSGSNAVFKVTTNASSPEYQWQVKTSASDWSDLINGSLYSGVTTLELTIIGVDVTMSGYQYRAKVKSSSPSSCTKNGNSGVLTVAANSWTGTTNTDWFTATNWSCGSVPTLSTDVVIPNVTKKPIIDDINSITAFANTLAIASGSSLTIESFNTLRVKDKLTNNGGTVTFEDSASLVQTNNVTNTGFITYKRKTAPVIHTDYTYWSSPVTLQTLFNISPTTLAGMFYSFNATTENWMQELSANTMIAGKGYIIRGPEPGINLAQYTASFQGVPNNGNINISIPSGGTSNLIGNPYPSAIDADLFLDANSGAIDGTLYLWTHNTGQNNGQYNSADYAVYNRTGGVIINEVTYSIGGTAALGKNTSAPNGSIAAGQAFFTTGTSAGGTVNFTNAMRIASTTMEDGSGVNQQFFKTKNPSKSSKPIEKNRIWLNLTNTQGAFKQTLVGYITDATNDYDDRFDGESFDGNEFVDFYSVNQDKNLVIQGRALPFDDADEVPLGFRTTINGDFTINIDQVDGLLANQAVFIEDKLTNIVTDLKGGNYTFNTTAGTFDNRFVLRFKDNSVPKTLAAANFDSLEKTVLVSNKNKQIRIDSAVERIDKVTVFDLLGRQIYQKANVNRNELSISNLVSNRQMLLVKTTLQNGKTVTKKIIY